jgi:hypothetical protein
MKSGAIPFQFDIGDVLSKLKRKASTRLGDVTINLPFISIAVSPKDKERQVARELIIRMRDRRVLSADECCDDCIDRALASLQEIRRLLIDKQVELADAQDGPLYLLIEAMVTPIRQFMTFEQSLNVPPMRSRDAGQGHYRPGDVRQAYFDGLEMLRGHLSRCLGQVAAIAGMEAPTDGLITQYHGPWLLEAYKPSPLLLEHAAEPGNSNGV